jgi:hypothetical protein
LPQIAPSFQPHTQKLNQLIDVLLRVLVDEIPKNELLVLFVFDEARMLGLSSKKESRFPLLRRSFQCLPFFQVDKEGVLLFCTVLDTTSKLANLSPAPLVDPSFRIRIKGNKLFPPFTMLDTIDAWYHEAKIRVVNPEEPATALMDSLVHEMVRGTQQPNDPTGAPQNGVPLWRHMTLEIVESTALAAMFGRPAYLPFLAFRYERSVKLGEKDLLDMLKVKLLCKPIKDLREQIVFEEELLPAYNTKWTKELIKITGHEFNISMTQALAILGAIASVDITAASRMATDLSSGHMRLVAAISKLRSCVYTFEVSEPMLALAAHQLMETIAPWWLIIKKYVQAQSNSCVPQGFRGEFACQILFLIANRKCVTVLFPRNQLAAIPLMEFVKVLFAKQIESIDNLVKKCKLELRDLCPEDRGIQDAAAILDFFRSTLAEKSEVEEFLGRVSDKTLD